MRTVQTMISDEGLLHIEIPAEYLMNVFEMGVTTNVTSDINDIHGMLTHFAREFKSTDEDCEFGRFLDKVAADAIGNGESFVELDED